MPVEIRQCSAQLLSRSGAKFAYSLLGVCTKAQPCLWDTKDCLRMMILQEVQQDEVCLSNLRVLGPNPPPAAGNGLQLFRPPTLDAEGPASASQHCAAAGPAVSIPLVRSVDVFLAAHLDSLPPQVNVYSARIPRLDLFKSRSATPC